MRLPTRPMMGGVRQQLRSTGVDAHAARLITAMGARNDAPVEVLGNDAVGFQVAGRRGA